MARILMFDDDETFLRILALILRDKGHEPFPSMKPEAAVELVRAVKPDLVMTDLMMPGVTGSMVYLAIRKEIGPELPIIICSGTRLKLSVKVDPKLSYCPKPSDFETLVACINRVIEANGLQ